MFAHVSRLLRNSGFMLIPHMPVRKDYSRTDFFADAQAALTVAAVLVPQSIAYALLAGLPPAHGLYAALLGGIAGSLWGSSRHLATGPIALVSLLTLTAVSPLAAAGSPEYIALVAVLALMVGVIQIGLGLLRSGFLMRLVPSSVLVGFSTGAAVMIILTQVPRLLGFYGSTSAFALPQMNFIVRSLPETNWYTLAIGAVSIAVLMLLKRIDRRIPATLVVLMLGIVASYILDLASFGVKLAGDIPARLPISDIPTLSFQTLFALGGDALVIALVGFMSTYAVVKEFSSRTGEKSNADQELVGQGFANLLSGLFRGHPVGGSLSRTAVNYDAGARTAWSGVYAAFVVVLVILFLTPVLSYLPNAVLAAIVITAVLPLIDIKEFRRQYAITRTDGIIAGATFAAVFVLRPDEAVLVGVILALALYLRKVMLVHVVEVAFHPEWRSLVMRSSYPQAEIFPRMLMLRIDAPVFYANIERLSDEIIEAVELWKEKNEAVPEVLLLDFSGVNHMDVTGVEGLAQMVRDIKKEHIKIIIATPRREIRKVLERGNLGDAVRFVHGMREVRQIGEVLTASDRTLVI